MPTSKTANLTRTGYIATEAVLTALAKEYVSGVGITDNVRGTYLKILVAHSQRELKELTKRPTQQDMLMAVGQAHDKLYPIILAAVTTPDVAPDEDATPEETSRRTRARNVRSNFARTSKSTLNRYVEAGGKLQSLIPADVTKEGLAALYAPVRAGPGTITQKIARVESTLENLLRTLAEDDPGAARAAIQDLNARLADIAPPVRAVAKSRRKVGDLVLHPHH